MLANRSGTAERVRLSRAEQGGRNQSKQCWIGVGSGEVGAAKEWAGMRIAEGAREPAAAANSQQAVSPCFTNRRGCCRRRAAAAGTDCNGCLAGAVQQAT